jgi:glutathione S-transferase
MKLIGSKTSPYVRKVRVVCAEKRLACDLVEENVWSATTAVGRYNPLTKVPVLVLDDGTCLYDSVVITEYLDTLAFPALIPPTGLARAVAKRGEALADGICDAAVGIVLERKRETLRQDPPTIDRQRAKIDASIAALSTELGGREWLGGDSPGLADLAAGCALFYVEFRLPEVGWRARHANLESWAGRLEARASFSSTRPPAP